MRAMPDTDDQAARITAALESFRVLNQTAAATPPIAALYRDMFPQLNLPAAYATDLHACLNAIAAALPDDQIAVLTLANSLGESEADKILVLRAGLLRVRGDTQWLHFNAATSLLRLASGGHAYAAIPARLHTALAVQLMPVDGDGTAYMHRLYAQQILPTAPREALKHALLSYRSGDSTAMAIIRHAAFRLGLIRPDTAEALPLSTLRALERSCGLPSSAPMALVGNGLAAGMSSVKIIEAASATIPPPHGDRFYHMFRTAGRLTETPSISIDVFEAGIVSFDITRLGLTQFYVFDSNGACVEDLSVGGTPFIADTVQTVPGDLGVLGDRHCGPMNICHFLLDHLTRAYLYDKATGGQPSLLLTDPHPRYRAILDHTGLSPRIIEPGAKRFSIRADRLLVSSNITADMRHPAHHAAPWALNSLRARFRIPDTTPSRRLFISRTGSKSRRILNWPVIEPILISFGFAVLNVEDLTLDEQIAAFAEAAYVAGVHGAGLTNILFAPPGLRVLEILPPLVATHAYWRLSHGLGHHYHALVADDPELPRPDYTPWGHHPEYNDRDLIIDPAQLTAALQSLTN
jgi:hypothetical protein